MDIFSNVGGNFLRQREAQDTTVNSEHEIIQALNLGDFDQALNLIAQSEKDKSNDSQYGYWKAQAYSIRCRNLRT